MRRIAQEVRDCVNVLGALHPVRPMREALLVVQLTADHLRRNLGSYVAVGSDVSSWNSEHFLKELPRKWELSFAIWDKCPIAYCIMSFRNGAVHIHQFMVDRAKRGEGIGALMLAEAKRIAGARLTLKVHRENVAARRFYEKRGFRLHSEENGHLVLSWCGSASAN